MTKIKAISYFLGGLVATLGAHYSYETVKNIIHKFKQEDHKEKIKQNRQIKSWVKGLNSNKESNLYKQLIKELQDLRDDLLFTWKEFPVGQVEDENQILYHFELIFAKHLSYLGITLESFRIALKKVNADDPSKKLLINQLLCLSDLEQFKVEAEDSSFQIQLPHEIGYNQELSEDLLKNLCAKKLFYIIIQLINKFSKNILDSYQKLRKTNDLNFREFNIINETFFQEKLVQNEQQQEALLLIFAENGFILELKNGKKPDSKFIKSELSYTDITWDQVQMLLRRYFFNDFNFRTNCILSHENLRLFLNNMILDAYICPECEETFHDTPLIDKVNKCPECKEATFTVKSYECLHCLKKDKFVKYTLCEICMQKSQKIKFDKILEKPEQFFDNCFGKQDNMKQLFEKQIEETEKYKIAKKESVIEIPSSENLSNNNNEESLQNSSGQNSNFEKI